MINPLGMLKVFTQVMMPADEDHPCLMIIPLSWVDSDFSAKWSKSIIQILILHLCNLRMHIICIRSVGEVGMKRIGHEMLEVEPHQCLPIQHHRTHLDHGIYMITPRP